MTEKHAEVLADCGLLDGVPREEWEELAVEVRDYEQDHELCRRGAEGTCLWVVVRGRIDVKSGGKLIAARTRPEVIGEMAILRDGGTRSADLFVAETPTELLEISRRMILVHPSAARIWQNVANLISAKLDRATQEREMLKGDLAEKTQLLRTWVGEDALSKFRLAPEAFMHGHRRQRVVIWFSDVVGFSRMAMDLAPERLGAIVQDFLSPQIQAIRRAEGFIDKFMGDGVMAYWLVGPDQDAECCAKALRTALDSLNRVQLIPHGAGHLDLRVGLHIAEVVAGNFGTPDRAQYTLIGHEVNKAARLEQARPESVTNEGHIAAVRVSDEFYGHLPAAEKELLPCRCDVECKGIGRIAVRSGEGAQEVKK